MKGNNYLTKKLTCVGNIFVIIYMPLIADRGKFLQLIVNFVCLFNACFRLVSL